MNSKLLTPLAATLLMIASGCTSGEAGSEVDEGYFGAPTMHNTMYMNGESSATAALSGRFAAEVPTTISFAFNRADITAEAAAILTQQAAWIAQFPEVRFRVYGHTDLVGSESYNDNLGLRRANAVVAFLASKGISRARLEGVASFGETQPVIVSQGPEQANRRAITDVVGFVSAGMTDGKYMQVVYREYVESAIRIHPTNTVVTTQVDPSE